MDLYWLKGIFELYFYSVLCLGLTKNSKYFCVLFHANTCSKKECGIVGLGFLNVSWGTKNVAFLDKQKWDSWSLVKSQKLKF